MWATTPLGELDGREKEERQKTPLNSAKAEKKSTNKKQTNRNTGGT